MTIRPAICSLVLFHLLLAELAIAGEATIHNRFEISKSRISGFQVSPSTSRVASAVSVDGAVTLYDFERQRPLWSKRFFQPLLGHRRQSVLAAARFSQDGRLLAVSRISGQSTFVINTLTGEKLAEFQDDNAQAGIAELRFSESNRILIGSAWRQRSLIVWNIESKKELIRLVQQPEDGAIFGPEPPLGFAALGQSAGVPNLVVEVNKNGTFIWNIASSEVKERFPPPRLDPFSGRASIRAAHVTDDGRYTLMVLAKESDEDTRTLAIQNNLNGKIESHTKVDIKGDHFNWLQVNENFVAEGFMAGSFFQWNILEDKDAIVYVSKEPWINENFGWPSTMRFQGFLSSDFAYSIIDDGIIGQWRFSE